MRYKLFISVLLLLFVVSSCTIKGYKPITSSVKGKITKPYIFDSDFQKALYKTSISIYGNELSGLTIFKKTDGAIRVVSMSELGMKYFDLEFPSDKTKPTIVHYIMEPLDKKLLVKLLDRDFRMLVYAPDIENSNILLNESNNSEMLAKFHKLLYYFDISGKISLIAKGGGMKEIVSISSYINRTPESIYIDRKKVWFKFEIVKP